MACIHTNGAAHTLHGALLLKFSGHACEGSFQSLECASIWLRLLGNEPAQLLDALLQFCNPITAWGA
jgi:hypothetical protein